MADVLSSGSCQLRCVDGGALLTLKMPRKSASENIVCLYRLLNTLAKFSNLFLHAGKLDQDQAAPHCLQEWFLKSQAMTIVVIGSLMVKNFYYIIRCVRLSRFADWCMFSRDVCRLLTTSLHHFVSTFGAWVLRRILITLEHVTPAY